MRDGGIFLAGLLLTAACRPLEVASVADAPAPAASPVSVTRRAEPAEVYPVPAATASAAGSTRRRTGPARRST